MAMTYYTSDLHLNHRLVAGIRGFGDRAEPDLEAHNEAVRRAWAHVRNDDIVWVLGDICVSGKWWDGALKLIKELPGRKRLVSGNHDPVASIHRDAWKHKLAALEVFEAVQDYAKTRVEGGTVLLCHYPYSGTGSEGLRGPDQVAKEERYTEFRLTDVGIPLIHGHTHGPERLHFSDRGTPQVHVGLDAWDMQLVPEREVAKLLDSADQSVKVDV